jgi:rubrerythrin
MDKSIAHLKEAYAGESQANRKYLAFAERADREGYPQAARLFRAAAEAEAIHALNHLRALQAIQTTAENLKEAMAGEVAEFEEMYPGMIADAHAEGHKEAERTFRFANEVEKIHASLFREALANLEARELAEIFVCPICGYTVAGEPPDNCPVCNAKKKLFRRID